MVHVTNWKVLKNETLIERRQRNQNVSERINKSGTRSTQATHRTVPIRLVSGVAANNCMLVESFVLAVLFNFSARFDGMQFHVLRTRRRCINQSPARCENFWQRNPLDNSHYWNGLFPSGGEKLRKIRGKRWKVQELFRWVDWIRFSFCFLESSSTGSAFQLQMTRDRECGGMFVD